jgi:hypothetical protein
MTRATGWRIGLQGKQRYRRTMWAHPFRGVALDEVVGVLIYRRATRRINQ